MSDPNEVRFTTKELLMDIRSDVRAIDAKLDLKADRERVHDLANRLTALELTAAGNAALILEHHAMKADVESLKSWRSKIVGAFGVVVLLVGAVAGRILGLF